MNPSLIDTYADGGRKLKSAIQGLSPADLAQRPIPNTWSLQEIVVHLMDSDLIASDRMKRIAAENRPLLIGYNQDAFMEKLHPEVVDAQMAAEVFHLNRQLTAAVLRSLPSDAFTRTGVHNERGLLSLEDLLSSYISHLDNHLDHLLRKRKLIGK